MSVGVALFGAGPMGALHAHNVYGNPAAVLKWVCGKSKDTAKTLAAQYAAKAGTTAEALADPEVQAVVVATPLSSHFELVMAAIAAKKHVMCEKPLAPTPEEIEKLYAAAASAGVLLLTAFHRRFDPHFAELKRNMSRVGSVEVVRAFSLDPMALRDDPKTNEAETRARLYDSLLHDFDMCDWLVGNGEHPTEVYAVQQRYDAILCVLKYASGVLAIVEWAGGVSYGYDQRLEVFGTGGLLSVNNPAKACVEFVGARAQSVGPHHPASHRFFETRYPPAYAAELSHFLESILKKQPVSVTGKEAVGSARTADRVLQYLYHPAQQMQKKVANSKAAFPKVGPLGTPTLRVGLLGAGRMGSIRASHMAKHPDIEVAYVCDQLVPRAQEMAKLYGGRAVSDVDTVLKDSSVQAVWISAPSNQHLELIKKAAAAKKHIYCEKPIGLTVDEVVEAYQYCESQGVLLLCGWNRRFDPHFCDLQQRATANKDSILSLCVNNGDHPLPDPDVLLNLGSLYHDFMVHDLDTAVWLFGSVPTKVVAIGSNFIPKMKTAGLLDTGVILLEFPNGGIACLSGRRCSVHGYDQRVELLGASSRNLYSVQNPRITAAVTYNGTGVVEAPLGFTFADRYFEAYGAEVGHLADVLLRGKEPRTNFVGSWAVAVLADAALESQSKAAPLVLKVE